MFFDNRGGIEYMVLESGSPHAFLYISLSVVQNVPILLNNSPPNVLDSTNVLLVRKYSMYRPFIIELEFYRMNWNVRRPLCVGGLTGFSEHLL